MSLEEVRASRLKKLTLLQEQGIDPYPAHTERSHEIQNVHKNFSKLEDSKKAVTIAGRIRAIRGHGGSTFVDVEDGTGKIQVFFKKDAIGNESYDLFQNTMDVGDFIDVIGQLFLTKKEERTLEVQNWKVLTKTLLPLPEKWHGLQDMEERYRKRYLDILMNPEVKDMVGKRSKFWQNIREFLLKEDFLEVETPVLENTTGGADARPFVTHHNALDMDVYLRISAGELWQKRLLVAGLPKVFEIGRIFRNEGMSMEHLQDYTQMEFYWAYADYTMGMKFVEKMYRYVAKKTFGALEFMIGDFTVDLSKKWERYDYAKTVKKMTGIDVWKAELSEIEEKLTEFSITPDESLWNKQRAVDTLWKYCRKQIAGPGFLVNVPVFMEPLAKRNPKDTNTVQRFQVLLAGSELGKGYSELNDPLDQASRFEEQAKLRAAGDEEAQMNDAEFVEALEYGMPPACGFGMSERVFAFLMNKPVRETQIFPLMRPK